MGKHRSGHSYQEFPILNVARRCGLVLNDRTLEWEEVEASCPFCGDHGPGKHHLFLNTTRNIFRCVLCGEKGNSVSLYAKMEGVSNRQAFRALSEDSVLYRFPQQPLSQKPAEREPSSLAVRHNVYYDMVTSPALMLLGAAITAVLTFLGTLFGQRLLRKHFQKAGIVG